MLRKRIIAFAMLMATLLGGNGCINAPNPNDYEKAIIDGVEQYVPKEFFEGFPDFEPKGNNDNHAEESAAEILSEDMIDIFSWLSKAAAVLGVITFALGMINPVIGRLGIGRWFGLVALCSMGIVYATPYMWWFIGGTVWVLVSFLIWKLYRNFKARIEKEKVIEELAMHFDDPEGHEKISEKARCDYLLHRSKGDSWKNTTASTQKTKTET